ncbi:hypothetical protein AU381_05870 [Sinorhizobium glycinis]|uniref:Uncharacterized protein n=1 Tax=Sinorhizobium glycinis TaxID=1472378 RepID=A0A178Y223_9HYPH|nr:hypothetical protein [Sinorhizobium glycinis]OAP41394.1 hypothetical protein AU381_05870 [Sinorhizobium glycinis]
MLIKIGGFEMEVSRGGMFLGINLGKRWRYQTFRTWTATGLSASDWIDRTPNSVADSKAVEAGRRGF